VITRPAAFAYSSRSQRLQLHRAFSYPGDRWGGVPVHPGLEGGDVAQVVLTAHSNLVPGGSFVIDSASPAGVAPLEAAVCSG